MQRLARFAIVPLVSASLLLSGCSLFGGNGPTPPQDDPLADALPPGTCLLERLEPGVVDRESAVDCAENHLFDVVGTVEWPGMKAALSGSETEVVYDELVAGENDHFIDAMYGKCDEELRSFLGIQFDYDGYSAADLQILPIGPVVDFSLQPRDAFEAGDHTVLCFVSWTDFEGQERSVQYPDGVSFADFATERFPTSLHTCADSGGTDTNVFLDCAEPHESQQLFSFRGGDVLGKEWIETVERDLTVPDYSVPDQVCADLIARIYPDLVNPGWEIWANMYRTSSGWSDWDGTYNPKAGYYFSCDLDAGDDSLAILGDAFSGTASIVPR